MCLIPEVYNDIYVRCNRCYDCLSQTRVEWKFRLNVEVRNSPYAYLVSLTYNDEHLPKTKDPRWSDITQMRKLLYRHMGYAPRYFVAHENGDKHGRNHFHMLIFCKHPISKQVFLKCWRNGFVDRRPITSNRIGYVVSYIHPNEVKPNVRLYRCSNGLGRNYNLPYRIVHRNGRVNTYPLPRYYSKINPEAKAWSEAYYFEKYGPKPKITDQSYLEHLYECWCRYDHRYRHGRYGSSKRPDYYTYVSSMMERHLRWVNKLQTVSIPARKGRLLARVSQLFECHGVRASGNLHPDLTHYCPMFFEDSKKTRDPPIPPGKTMRNMFWDVLRHPLNYFLDIQNFNAYNAYGHIQYDMGVDSSAPSIGQQQE